MDSIDLIRIATAVLALLVAIIGHEIMHGWVAYKYGDMTAKNAGRLTINPIPHIDPIGSLLVPAMMYFIPMLFGSDGGFLFGWAKPVPINTRTVVDNGGFNAAMQVSLAGITYNFIVAALAAAFLLAMSQPLVSDSMFYLFAYFLVMQLVIINVVLGVFNLLPIPQFDGAHFLMYAALKYNYNAVAQWFYKMERYGMIIVVLILITPIHQYVLLAPVQFVLQFLLA
ncbi:MAG: site-2 protease family protein [Sulfurimonadaceae bacterium]